MEAANKKQYISDTYVLLLQKTPGDKITVKMLIDACGLSRQTFYYHFKDIIDVVEYILHSILEDTTRKCSDVDDSRTAIRLFLVMIEENRRLVKRLEDTSRCKDFQRYVAHGIADTMQTVLKKKEPKAYAVLISDMDFLLSFFSYGLLGHALEQIEHNQPLEIDRLTDQLYRLYKGEMKSFDN